MPERLITVAGSMEAFMAEVMGDMGDGDKQLEIC
jgi:hypothetical protein